jgi:hypothetical protein
MQSLGSDIICLTLKTSRNGNVGPFHPKDYFTESLISVEMYPSFDAPLDEESPTEAGYQTKNIPHSHCGAVDPIHAALQQNHLSE